jgi:hypothetical protein
MAFLAGFAMTGGLRRNFLAKVVFDASYENNQKKSARWISPRISQRALFSQPLAWVVFG